MIHVLFAKHFYSHIFNKNKSLCQLFEMHKVAYMTIQITSMLLSLFALSGPVGDYSFAYIMTKKGSRLVVRGVANCSSNYACWGDYILRGSNPLRGSIAYTNIA